jgi:hypothetical protein
MASTPYSPPAAAASPRRPWFIRWWYDPVQRKRAIIATVLALLYGSGVAYGSWTRVCAAERCPSIMRLNPERGGPQQTSKVYAADGRLITELGIERRTVLPLEQIPMYVRQAFIAVEDKRFYHHSGIDYWRILGALKANITTLHYAQGFSTITMQLARNVFPEHLGKEKKIARKLREARVAVELERNFPKDTILELYLNQISLGPNVAGVEAAAQVFFGKSARDLNVAEAATLAGLPKAPGTYNPRTHPDRAVRRRNAILNLMRDQGFLSPEDAEYWKAYPLVLTTRRTSYGDVAPYFVEWLRSAFLEPRFGRDLYEKGLRIYTTLDLDMQEAAEQALQSQLDEIESGVYSNGKFEGTSYREYVEQGRATPDDQGPFAPYLQGALLAVDAKTGNILAMVGGRDFVDSKWNRVTQSARPPGSTFKPFVYSAAVRAGHPVTEMLDDSPLNPPVIQLDSSLWQPKDYDDTTLGMIPMRQPTSAQPLDDQAGHGPRRADGHRRGAPLRHHDAAAALPVDSHRRARDKADRADRGVHRVRQRWYSRRPDRHPAHRGPAGQHPVSVHDQTRAGHRPGAQLAHARHVARCHALPARLRPAPVRHCRGRRRGSACADGREDRHDRRLHRRLVRRLHPGNRDRHLDWLRPAAPHHEQRRRRPHRRPCVDKVHARRV